MVTWFAGLDHTLQALLATLFTWGVTALGAGMVFFPETKPVEQDVTAIVQAIPGMPASVAAKMIDVPMEGDVCGRCTAYDAEIGRCTERGFRVKPTAPGCDYFVKRTN